MSLKSSIITSPDTNTTLEKECDLLKSAYLFSDKVSITSPGITSILMLLKLANLSEKEKIEYLIGMSKVDPSLKGEEYAKAIKLKNQLSRKTFKTNEETIQLNRIKHHLKNLDRYFEEWGSKLFLESTLPQFIQLIEDKVIELNHLDVNEVNSSMAMQILDHTVNLLSEKEAYPLFDQLTENLAAAFMKKNNHLDTNIHVKESFVTKELILSLPNLKSLSFEQITNLKSELDVEFERFRGLVINLAKEIQGIPFTVENRSLFQKTLKYELGPEIKELQRRIDNNSFVSNLFHEIGGNLGNYSLFLGVSTWSDLENALLGAGGISLTAASFKAYKKTKDEKGKIKYSSLYFYHEMSKK